MAAQILGRFAGTRHLIPALLRNTIKPNISAISKGLQAQTLKRTFLTGSAASSKKEDVSVTFVFPDGARVEAKGKEDDSLLDIIINDNVEVDGFGACEGTLACSTCHLIFSQEVYDKLPEEPTDEELDMLDLAYGLTDTSRLGCQVCISKQLNGIEVQVPEGINDQR